MEMNIIKTKSMVISREKPVPNISISVEEKPIQQVDIHGVPGLHGNRRWKM